MPMAPSCLPARASDRASDRDGPESPCGHVPGKRGAIEEGRQIEFWAVLSSLKQTHDYVSGGHALIGQIWAQTSFSDCGRKTAEGSEHVLTMSSFLTLQTGRVTELVPTCVNHSRAVRVPS